MAIFRPGYCKENVHNLGATVTFHQCRFKASRDGYCGIHHPDADAVRRQKSNAAFKARMKKDPLLLARRRVRALEKEVRRLKKLVSRN